MNKTLKKLALLPILTMLFSCGSNNSSYEYHAYCDMFQFYQNDMQINFAYERHSANPIAYMTVINKSVYPVKVSVSDAKIIRETTSAQYTVDYTPHVANIESDMFTDFYFNSALPTSTADENYEIRFTLNNYRFFVKLYEMPDELREDVTLTYTINNEVVHQETMKQGREIKKTYVYETDDHQSYASYWKDEDGMSYGLGRRVDYDVTLYGTLEYSLKLLTTTSDVFVYINGVNHVHSDGKVVVAPTYLDKEVCIGNYAFYQNPDIKEIYLPTTLHQIYNGNFLGCGNLTTIYFAGSQEQWEAIPKSTVQLPETVSIVYNTPFTVN